MFTDKARAYIARGKAATYLLCENVAGHMEKHAKENAPWKDRTSHARQSINGRATRAGDTTIMSIAHGVRYGKYLEKEHRRTTSGRRLKRLCTGRAQITR